jgi:Holliday junction resolvasome RuvABC DNA-binding subunit
VAEANVQAFRALRTLGFREDETRRALERVRAGGVDGDMESVLRAALGVLT